MHSIPKIVSLALFILGNVLVAAPNTLTPAEKKEGWVLLFDGVSLDGWKASENPATFSVADGCIVVDGPRAHLFYTGPFENARFKDFEMKLEVKTFPQANSGVYFHTAYQEQGWPAKGYEVQVNATHRNEKKTASLFGIRDQPDPLVEDGTWFTLRIRVEGKRIRTWVDDKLIVDYTEESPPERTRQFAGRIISEGTFALQGHDPESRTHFRSIRVKTLP